MFDGNQLLSLLLQCDIALKINFVKQINDSIYFSIEFLFNA